MSSRQPKPSAKIKKLPKVAIIMGSQTDLKVMAGAIEALKEFAIPHTLEIISAHRTPDRLIEFSRQARQQGIAVIIAGAGGAAHLPGMVAAVTTLPVIGVPVLIGKLKGVDALLSIAQMPKGVPVACVAVDNSYNAGLLAAQILSISNPKLASSLEKLKNTMKTKVRRMNDSLKSKTLKVPRKNGKP